MLSPHEKLICLLIDEIYVNPGLNYKGGKLLGKAENANQQANTIQAFMITSLFSKYKEIVALVSMKNQTADDLYCQTLKVLQMLNDCKYNVLCLISDNNRINRNMFTQMCQGNLVNCISNPVQPENKLFFLFDTVHLIKSVNNWFNEKPLGQVLCFPSPDNSSKISLAKLQDLKDIYETEKSNLIKNAPKLSQKVLYPTSFEKQNVLLALNIFHESNSAALAHEAGEKGKDIMGTKEFIDQFLKWWNIVNVKNSEKEKKGEFHIKSLEIFEATSETSVEFEVDEELYEVFDTTTDVEISPEEMPAFIYISGTILSILCGIFSTLIEEKGATGSSSQVSIALPIGRQNSLGPVVVPSKEFSR
ncbi:hypothetical protein AVEN_167218-1 [Araneus ventricosus]|uniref:Transposable element P transposase-like RNase H domain-containing protein n=1 Tax=Araneus ventricosus TaxID=182803 RepID=A0A4Y2SC72_ARAVE|nr:hypothetical protein AVEN_167218-1 [Araneus ventricosus]